MTSFVTRLRGIVGTAVAWGAAWAVPGLLAGVPQWILVGALAGAGFATALTMAERRRRLEQLTLGRVAAWGALGAVVSAAVATPVLLLATGGALQLLPFLAAVGGLGAGSAAGTVAVAQRADVRERLGRGERLRLPDG